MVKLSTYIGKLKTDIVKDYKKKLDQQLKNDLLPLDEEKKSLERLLKDKKRSLILQKKLISDTYKKNQNEAVKEARKLTFVHEIWEKSLDKFFKNNANDWYRSLIKEIPNKVGILKYSPNTPTAIIKMIKKINPKLKLEEDKDISQGFIYVSDKFVLELTREVFSQEHFPSFKRKLYKEFENIS